MNDTIRRIGAAIIDFLLTYGSIIIYLFAYRLFILQPQSAAQANHMLLCTFFTLIILCIYIPTKRNGQTLGKMLFHLQVINTNGKRRTWYQNFLRECVVKFTFIMFILPLDIIYAIIQCIRERKLIMTFAHDQILHTIVRRKEKKDGVIS